MPHQLIPEISWRIVISHDQVSILCSICAARTVACSRLFMTRFLRMKGFWYFWPSIADGESEASIRLLKPEGNLLQIMQASLSVRALACKYMPCCLEDAHSQMFSLGSLFLKLTFICLMAKFIFRAL